MFNINLAHKPRRLTYFLPETNKPETHYCVSRPGFRCLEWFRVSDSPRASSPRLYKQDAGIAAPQPPKQSGRGRVPFLTAKGRRSSIRREHGALCWRCTRWRVFHAARARAGARGRGRPRSTTTTRTAGAPGESSLPRSRGTWFCSRKKFHHQLHSTGSACIWDHELGPRMTPRDSHRFRVPVVRST